MITNVPACSWLIEPWDYVEFTSMTDLSRYLLSPRNRMAVNARLIGEIEKSRPRSIFEGNGGTFSVALCDEFGDFDMVGIVWQTASYDLSA